MIRFPFNKPVYIPRLAQEVAAAFGAAESQVFGHGAGPVVSIGAIGVPDHITAEQVAAVVAAHNGTRTDEERLEEAPLASKVRAAMVLRLSDQWTNLPIVRRNRVQQIINEAAAAIISALG